jgi:hypothetical protein
MDQEIRQCQNCKKDFTIGPEDFDFYEKIGVPSSSWCYECRMKQLLVWRNDRSLYKRNCDFCNKPIITIYHPDSPYVVYCINCYRSDKWDPYSYGKNYNFNRPFFDQFKELLLRVPKEAVNNSGVNVNSEYVNHAHNNNNCYLIFNSGDNEDCFYSSGIRKCRDVTDIHYGENLEQCYGIVNGSNCSRCIHSKNIFDCVDVLFSMDLRGCQNCFGCSNLTRKNYHFFNQPLSKEDWDKKVKESLGSFSSVSEVLNKFEQFSLLSPRRANNIYKSVDCIGDYIFESKQAKNCFEAVHCENCKNGFFVRLLKDSLDTVGFGYNSELLLSCVAVGYSANIIGSCKLKDARDTCYSFSLNSSQDCIGCNGLKNAQNCVLNKQHPEEEYQKIKDHIIEELKQKGVYGLGLPALLSPWAYNETMAQEIFPLAKEQALEQGYSWRTPEERNYQITLKTDQVPDNIQDVPDTIINEVIECANHQLQTTNYELTNCTEAFRIIPQELQFYRKMGLPIPRLCPNCRHYQRLKQRNPLKLWTRQCMCTGKTSVNQSQGQTSSSGAYQNTCLHEHGDNPCPNTFETSYAPDRPEIVYCEQCYLKEVA